MSADALARLAAAPVQMVGRPFAPEDQAAIEAARLLGLDQPRRRVPTAELVIEGEYALAMLDQIAPDEAAEQLRAYYRGVVDGVQAEARRRLRRTTDQQAGWSRIAEGMVQRVKDAVPLQEFIQWGGAVNLMPHPRGAPRYWMGRCPFHRDETPSFAVWPTHFVCFGCGERGDVFTYARLRAGLRPGQFTEAVQIVAAYAGIDQTPRPTRGTRLRDAFENPT